MDETDFQELLDGLATGVSRENVDGLREAEEILPIFKLIRSLFSSSQADTALKLVVLFHLAQTDGRFTRERIRSIVRAVSDERLDALITSLYNGEWLKLREADRTYRVNPLGMYLLAVLRAANFASQTPANLLIRAAEAMTFGDRVDADGDTTTRLLGVLLAEIESQAERAREVLRLGRPRDMVRFSREEVRDQVHHVDQILEAMEARFGRSAELFDRYVRIHEAMQTILRAHKGLTQRLAEWNLKKLETAGAGYSLTALCDATMGASESDLLAAVTSGALTPPAPVVGFSTEDAMSRYRTERTTSRRTRESFVYAPPPEPTAEALRPEDVDPVARLRRNLAALTAEVKPGESLSVGVWLAEHSEDFADAVFLLNLLARLEGQATEGIEVATGMRLTPHTTSPDPDAWRDLDPVAALEALVRLGALARVTGRGLHPNILLRREPSREADHG